MMIVAVPGGFFLAQGFLERVQQCVPCLHFLVCFFFNGDQLAHTNSALYARMWLSELR